MALRASLLFAAVTGTAAAQQTASTVCVYNSAWFVLKWHLSSTDGLGQSGETKSYPVGQVKCMSADIGGNVTAGASLAPVVKAVWGKEITAPDTILYDPVNATQITYVCKGTTLDFHCDQGPMPPTAANVTKAIGEFALGFADGLGTELGFVDCIADANKTFHDIVAVVDFFETGFNGKLLPSLEHAFQLLGSTLQDFSAAITECEKSATDFAAKVKTVAAALSGNPWSIMKVVVDDAVHIFKDRTEISADCKAVTADWRAQDYKGSGHAIGDIVGIILDGL